MFTISIIRNLKWKYPITDSFNFTLNKKLIHEHLMDLFNKHEVIYKHQFGFQWEKSTEHAVLDLLYNSISAGNKRQGLFNFSRSCKGIQYCEPWHITFLNWIILLCGWPLKLIQSYLSGTVFSPINALFFKCCSPVNTPPKIDFLYINSPLF